MPEKMSPYDLVGIVALFLFLGIVTIFPDLGKRLLRWIGGIFIVAFTTCGLVILGVLLYAMFTSHEGSLR